MEDFATFIAQERKRLDEQKQEIQQQKAKLDEQIAEIDKELKAIDAYERAKTGATTGKRTRRSGVRDSVLTEVKKHPDGISRSMLLEMMNAKGDKKAEQSISNALANLKKSGQLTADEGIYKAA